MSHPFARDFVLGATRGSLVRPGAASFGAVAIDGRTVAPGGLWFAIRGGRLDGHDFVAQAVERGAAGVVVERGRGQGLAVGRGVAIIEVDDTTLALGALARAHRLRLADLRVIAITGSYGKTTTKELVAALLGAAAGDEAVLKTAGNFNNHLGLPLTLLRLGAQHRFAVIEMGMSGRGEIAYLADLARPDIGVVVSLGPVHLEQLGTLANVAAAKGELFSALPPGGVKIWPFDEPLLAAQAQASPAVRGLRFGPGVGVEVRYHDVEVSAAGTRFRLRLPDGESAAIELALIGAHTAHDAAAAAAVGCALGLSPATIAAGLAAARTEKHRSQLLDLGGRRLLDDCYNASPPSTAAALATLVALRGGGRAIAVLGDMLELGPDEASLHRSIGATAARLGVDLLVTVGERSRHTAQGARDAGLVPGRLHTTATPDEAAAIVGAFAEPGDTILVKASRGLRLEVVVERLAQRFAAAQQGAV